MSRRLAIYEFDLTLFEEILKGGLWGYGAPMRVTTDVPEDAKVQRAEFDMDRSMIRLLVESEEFDEVPLRTIAPTRTATFTRHVTENDRLTGLFMGRCPNCGGEIPA